MDIVLFIGVSVSAFINLDIFGERAQMANEVEVGTPVTKVVHVTKTNNAYEFSVNPGLFFH